MAHGTCYSTKLPTSSKTFRKSFHSNESEPRWWIETRSGPWETEQSWELPSLHPQQRFPCCVAERLEIDVVHLESAENKVKVHMVWNSICILYLKPKQPLRSSSKMGWIFSWNTLPKRENSLFSQWFWLSMTCQPWLLLHHSEQARTIRLKAINA